MQNDERRNQAWRTFRVRYQIIAIEELDINMRTAGCPSCNMLTQLDEKGMVSLSSVPNGTSFCKFHHGGLKENYGRRASDNLANYEDLSME